MKSVLAAVALALVALVVTAGTASAHWNIELADGTHRIEAGQSVAFPTELHYHRLVGHVRAMDGADASLAVSVMGPDEGAVRHVAGPGADFVINDLIACCKGTGWAAHTIIVENRGDRPVDVDMRLVLLHDGVAVIGEDAEPGAAATTLAFFAIATVVFARKLRQGPLPGDARPWAAWAMGAYAGLWGVALLFSAWGMARYGGGPVAGLMAVPAHLPWVGNAFVTTVDVIVLALIVLWIAAGATWTGAVRRAPSQRGLGTFGILMGIGSLVACLVWAIEYATVVVPALMALATVPVPLVVGWRVVARHARSGQLEPAQEPG